MVLKSVSTMVSLVRKLFPKMEKSMSAGLFLVVLLLVGAVQFCFSKNSTFGCIQREREALLNLKRSFNDPKSRLVSWTGEDCCQWKGVSCNKNTGHVVKLDLRDPSEFDEFYFGSLSASKVNSDLAELKHLEYLDLSGNDFNFSPIPEFIGSLKHLKYLNLSTAEFYGWIPRQLGNLTSLQVLDLNDYGYIYDWPLYADNTQWVSRLSSLQYLDMSGVYLGEALDTIQVLNTLPSLLDLSLNDCGIENIHFRRGSPNSSFLASVQSLGLSENSLTGPIPNALQNMTAIKKLDLSLNDFNSTIPLWLVNSKSLVDLNLMGNRFVQIEGGLFSILNQACSLKSLDLSSNEFLGEVLGGEKNSSSCPAYDLENLDLSYNGISSNLPDWLGKLKLLRHLDLSGNSFYGPIPSSLGELPMLRSLDLSVNHLNGAIPQFAGRTLESLDLSQNQLIGIIPQSLGRLQMLVLLDLSNNQLNGTIPQSLGRLQMLVLLDLSNNQLNGTIPQSLGRLQMLELLDLSNNQLNGTIPETLGKLSTLESLDLSHNELTGSIPYSLGQLVNLTELDISSNSLQGIVSEFNFANLSNLRSLNIGFNHLTFNIKSDWIPPFSLYHINMSSCGIGAQFPQWLQTQNEVERLDLSSANMSGGFPIWFHMSALYYLDLSSTQITGSLPTNIGDNFPQLAELYLANNLIDGPVPTSLCKLDGLQLIDLSKNNLSGEIPDCWREAQQLLLINFASNKLSGTIPSSFGHLSALKWLHLNDNGLLGELPLAMRNCKGLELLDLGENKISGTIPAWLGDSLSSLRFLKLRKNMFDGNIPVSLCRLSEIQVLDLAHNNLSGGIYHCFGKLTGMTSENNVFQQGVMTLASGPLASAPGPASIVSPPLPAAPPTLATPPTQWLLGPGFEEESQWHKEKLSVVTKGASLEYTTTLRLLDSMDLSSNRLIGSIPEELGALSGLRSLNLSHNRLSGNIPKKIGGLKLIESLDLSDNQLSGPIPQSMANLTSINHLNLSYNNLSGRIPKGNQLQVLENPTAIYAGNAQLCGDPLQTKCPGDEDSVQPPTSNGHGDEDHEEDKKEKILFYFVVLAGYATGLWGVIGTLVLRRSWRVTYFRFVDNTKDRIIVAVAVKVARLKKRMQAEDQH